MKLHRLLVFAALILFAHPEGLAQPGVDPRINPLSTCNDDYLTKEYVFTGQVRTLQEVPTNNVRPFWKTTVAIETSIKGQLSGEIELTLPKLLLPPVPESEVIGKRFIFTANHVTNAEISGLFSNAWSTQIDDIAPDVLAKVIAGIRAVLQGVPQPRIVGRVREQSLETGFQADDGRPLAGLVVVASSEEGQKFQTKTDAHGRFQFKKLPPGRYTVNPILPKKMDLNGYGPTPDSENRYITIGERLCSVELSFIAQETGRVTGRIENVTGGQDVKPIVVLYPVDRKSRRIDPRANYRTPSQTSWSTTGAENTLSFSFDQVPVGLYVLSITTHNQTIYYPGVVHSDQARAIKVVSEKPTELLIKLP